MRRIWCVAAREFRVTVATKGFIIGMLLVPFVLALTALLVPRLINETPPRIEGEIAIVDPTDVIAAGLREHLRPERIAWRQEESKRQIAENMPPALSLALAEAPQGQAAVAQALQQAMGEAPRLDVVELTPDPDLDEAKAPLAQDAATTDPKGRLALVVVHPDAVVRQPGQTAFGSYDLFVRSKLDDRIINEIRGGLREVIIAARIRASGLDRTQVEGLVQVDEGGSRVVTAAGERASNPALSMLVPGGFMMLLFMAVMTSGQALLSNTVEEKSNRVVEVLLSAVSARELMVGKILGHLAVGLLVLGLYSGLGFVALFSFAMLGLLELQLVVFLIVFFLLAYFTIGSFMAAIGSAINELREAQAAMTPLMLTMMLPLMLWMPISRDPNSLFATILSFVPPLGNFIMLLRLSTPSPPPLWQILLSITVSAGGMVLSVWTAAKVFRIGLLMYGRPPSLRTLWRWARMPG